MIGENVGKYRVLERIGRGGMGTVYRALDQTLHREVAIKALNAELNDPEVAKRFRAEAVTVARLNHPGIATIYELFEHEGQWLMVMEFVRGETLEHMAERMGPLSPQRAAELCMQVLTALAHAHSLGVVHRDLKPANLMITENGAVKIMDFGIARVSGSEHLTGVGFMMGTPAYMAPEQVMGHEIDSRADLYSMGVVFYRLTSGKLPFKGDTPFAMAHSQVHDPPTPIGMQRSDLPTWADQVVARALAKTPDERFQSAVEFYEAFSRCLAGLPMTTLYNPTAQTEMLMTPARAMPTGGLASGPTSGGMPSGYGNPTGSRLTSSGPMAQTGYASQTGQTGAGAPVDPTAPTAPFVPPPLPQATGQAPITAQAPTAPINLPKPSVKKTDFAILGVAAGVVLLIGIVGVIWWKSRGSEPVPEPTTIQAEATPPATPTPDVTPPVVDPAAVTPTPTVTTTPTPVAATPTPATPAPTPTPSVTPGRTGSATPTPGASRGTNPGRSGDGRLGTAALTTPTPTPTPLATPTATPTVEPKPPAVADDHVAFSGIKLLTVTGKKAQDRDVVVNFVGGQISVTAKSGGAAITSLAYRSIVKATYVHGKDPKYDASLTSPPDDLDLPGGLFGGRPTRHWLVLQTRGQFMMLWLNDSNATKILETIEARSGLRIDRPAAARGGFNF